MVELIIDTDIGCDCDDAGALAVAHALCNLKKCNIIAMTHCTSELSGINTIYDINTFYRRGDIPLGIYKPEGLLDRLPKKYSRDVEARFGKLYEKKSECEDAVLTLRRAYANAKEPITLAAVGPLAVVSAFLESKSDEISEMTGIDLVKNNGGDLVQMACRFDVNEAEWNVEQDIAAARNVFKKWPCDIYVLPFETGEKVLTGKCLMPRGDSDPVAYSYKVWLDGKGEARSSWDPAALLFAITHDETVFTLSDCGTVTIDVKGVSKFLPGEGRHYVITSHAPDELREKIENLISIMP